MITLGTLLEGETVVVLGALVAHQGYLNLVGVMIAAFVGSFVAGQTIFHIGRARGEAWLDRRPFVAKRAERARRLAKRFQYGLVPAYRFFYGFRTVFPLLWSLEGMSPRRFFFLDLLGAALWAIGLSSLGWVIGRTLQKYLAHLGQYEFGLFLALAAMGVVIVGFRYFRNRRTKANPA